MQLCRQDQDSTLQWEGDVQKGNYLSVGSGIEDVVSNANTARPNRAVQFENPTYRIAERTTGSRSSSEQTLRFEEIRVTRYANSEFESNFDQYKIR